MLSLSQLSIERAGKTVVSQVSLDLLPGKTAVLMGPNGSGKSSLAYALLGHPSCTVTNGTVFYNGNDLLALAPHERARAGIFLAMQYSQELPGVTVSTFLREAYQFLTQEQTFDEKIKGLITAVGLTESFLHRSVNHGFSGGEKKRFELLQLLLFKPKIALLDEIDSGLDIDGLNSITELLAIARTESPELSLLIITHNTHMLDYLSVDTVHILRQGTLTYSGDASVIPLLRAQGYDGLSTI